VPGQGRGMPRPYNGLVEAGLTLFFLREHGDAGAPGAAHGLCATRLHAKLRFLRKTTCDYQLVDGHLTFTSPVQTRRTRRTTPCTPLVSRRAGPRESAGGAAAMEFRRGRPRGPGKAAEPLRNQRFADDHGVPRGAHAGGAAARRLPRIEQYRADHPRRAAIDSRCARPASTGWPTQGYERIGILGTSLGSCVAFIAAAHDPRIKVGIFNHVSMYFSDVVWTGLSTQHVRKGFGDVVSQDDLRRYWAMISPASYLRRMQGSEMRNLLIWARHDSSFLPVYSQQVLSARSANWSCRTRSTRCPAGITPRGSFRSS
jgi:hypothetical protein